MAIIPLPEPKLLLYIPSQHAEAEVTYYNTKSFCAQFGCELCVVHETDLDRQLGDILDLFELLKICPLPDQNQPTETAPPQVFLFMLCGFEAKAREALLKGLRKAGLGKGDLKAMVTPNNIHWTLRHILTDVQLEHEIMTAYMSLRETVRVVEILNERVGLPTDVQAHFDETFAEAYQLLSQEEVPTDIAKMQDLEKRLKFLMKQRFEL